MIGTVCRYVYIRKAGSVVLLPQIWARGVTLISTVLTHAKRITNSVYGDIHVSLVF